MRRTICLLASAALLAMFCGCQSMPMLANQDGGLPPVDTGNGVPETLPQDTGESAVVEDLEGQVVPAPEMPVVAHGEGMTYGGCGGCDTGCGGQACYPYHRHGLHARNMHHVFPGPHGPPVGQVTYPYYILKGPRCFLADDPPSIGP